MAAPTKTKTCKSCGAKMPMSAKVCPRCGMKM